MRIVNYIFTFILAVFFPLNLFSHSTRQDSQGIPAIQITDACNDPLIKRPVRGLYALEVGSMSAVSRYLSPVEYSGFRFGLSGYWTKLLPQSPARWRMHFEGGAGAALGLLNPRGTASMQGIDINFAWHCAAYRHLPYGLTISAGPGITTEGGILALLKNSNNPVSINLMAAVSARTDLLWETHIKRLPVTARLSLSIPLAGAFFMPGYGETYYEISLGNRNGLAHALWPGNYPQINLNTGVSFDFGKTSMELGYHLYWRRSTANNLVERQCRNMFYIGIIPGGGR